MKIVSIPGKIHYVAHPFSLKEKLAAFQRAEQEKWGKVIQAAHVKPE